MGTLAPPQTRNIFIRGIIQINQCSNVSNTAYVTHNDATDTISATVQTTVIDNQPPTISCPPDITQAGDSGECFATIPLLGYPLVVDNCSPSTLITVSNDAPATNQFPIGVSIITWSAEDVAGNTSTCEQTIIVTDDENPTINCVGNQVVDTDPGACTYTHSGMAWNATGSDNCTVVSIEYALSGATTGSGTSLDGVTFNLGVTSVEWTITDGSGNTAQCSYTVTVEDNENPIINCVGNQVADTNPGTCTYTHSGMAWNATGSDNCTVVSIEYELIGATSGSGTSLDGVTFNLGVTTVEWTITDNSGNTAQCSYTVTVEDNENPIINCVGNQVVDTDPGACTYTHIGMAWNATGSDNCTVVSIEYTLSGATTGSGTSLDGVTFNLGVTSVEWTITDGSGNTAQCSYTVTVEDNENPIINCVGNQLADTDPGVCSYTYNGTTWNVTGSDNCTVVSIEYELSGATTGSGTSLDGVTFNLGVTTVEWTITDGSGNTAQCSYTVTVQDNESPIINCIGNQVADTDPGTCLYTHNGNGWDASGSDNCSVASIEFTLSGATTGSGTSLDGVTFNLGVTTVEWTITDNSGNTAVCSYTVTVEDNENPTINCIANQVVETDTAVCNYTHSGIGWDATGSDNCTVASIEYLLSGATSGAGTTLNGVIFNPSVTTVNWTITDNSGNTAVCSYTVTVEDNENPTINCIANQVVETDTAVCNYTHSGIGWDATGSDNCTVASIEYLLSGATSGTGTTLNGVIFNSGVTTVNWTITDNSGNTAVCSYTVTVEDNEIPVINCIANQVVETDTTVCNYTHSGTGWDATGSDNCAVASIEYLLSGATSGSGTTLNGVIFNPGVTTVNWTITDNSGNTAQCSYTVTVEDNENPIINCVDNQVVDTDPGACSYTHNGTAWNATGSDNCTVVSIEYELSGATSGSGTSLDGVTFNLGVTTVEWTITDNSGNTAQCSYTVSVEDNENPIINCVGIQVVGADPGACTYTHIGMAWNATGSDNCTVVSIEYELSGATSGSGTSLDGVTFNLGMTTVEWTITDNSGNTAQCSYTVTVEDNENPTINCITNQVVDTDAGVCNYTHNGTAWDATGSDNCTVASIEYLLSGATSGSGTTLNGVIFNPGVTTVEWTITDGSGNTAVCSYTVTVEDNENPTINCVTNQVVNTDLGLCAYTHSGTGWDATGSDNCTVASIEYLLSGATIGSGTTLNGVIFNPGVTTVEWTITDGSNNTAVCSYTVTAEDNENPVINCIADQVVETDAGVCNYTHNGTAWDATGSDNCTVASIEYLLSGATSGSGTTLNGVIFNPGVTTVEWTITDGSGNTAVCSYTVTVEDNENPTINCVTNQLVNTDLGLCTYTQSGTGWDATGSDNCTVASIEYLLSGATIGSGTTLNGVIFNPGVTTVEWTITDGSGNTAVCSYTVTVEDNENPVINCITDQVVETNPTVCNYTHSGTGWDATGSDNCTVASIEYLLSGATSGSGTTLNGVIFNPGVTTVEWTITDGSGNTAVCSYTVTVEDNEIPTINCVTNQVVNTDLGLCTYTHSGTAWDATGSDNCTVASIEYLLSGATSGSGTTLNGVIFNPGVTTVEWTITDGSGNTAVCSYTVTVEDNENPTINCVTNQVVNTDLGLCTYTHSGTAWDATGSDNCTVASIEYLLSGATSGSGTTLNGVIFNPGITTVEWTITDGSGNTAVCSYTVTVLDNEIPVINCITNQVVDTDAGSLATTLIMEPDGMPQVLTTAPSLPLNICSAGPQADREQR
jgi:hypothetical protein